MIVAGRAPVRTEIVVPVGRADHRGQDLRHWWGRQGRWTLESGVMDVPSLSPTELPQEHEEHRELPPPTPRVGPWVSPMAPPPPVGVPKRRIWPWVLGAVGITVVVVFVGLGALGIWLRNQPLIDDDLHGGNGPFVAESDPYVDLRYEDDGYVMDLAALPDGNLQFARSFWEMSRPSVDFSISYDLGDVTVVREEYGIGVGCVGAGGSYWVVLTGDGIARLGVDGAESAVLDEVEVGSLPSAGRLRLDCTDGTGSAPTTITAHLDGEQIAHAEHANGFGSFHAVGILAASGPDEPLAVVWDDASAD